MNQIKSVIILAFNPLYINKKSLSVSLKSTSSGLNHDESEAQLKETALIEKSKV